MKIYDTKTAPTPRRVRIFLAEKNIPMDYVQLDLQKGDNLSAEMRAKNPLAKVPVLELDDGTCIAESKAICVYFENLHPEPALMGTTPLEKAQIEMWDRQVEFALFIQVGMCFQHTTGFFADRMTPIKDYGENCYKNASGYLRLLEKRLAESSYIAGEQFSIADITALCAIDFARVIKLRIADDQPHLLDWYQRVSGRPSAGA